MDIGSVVLVWETAFASGYRLEVSDDLTSWAELASTSEGDGDGDMLAVSGAGRYLRLSMVQRGTRYGYSLYETEVYARPR